MNDKLNLQSLVDVLAEKHGMDKKSADEFVKEFFYLIEQSLKTDKYVKIRGLGTFKLINVGSRESVNVNTGERFEIGSHTKVAFTPEPSLKELINKPFAHFETVPLNDEVALADTPAEDENKAEEEVEAPVALVTEELVAEEPPTVEEKPVAEEQPVAEEPITEEPVAKESVPVAELPRPKRDANAMRYFYLIVLLVVLFCGGVVLFMYYPDLLDRPAKTDVVEEEVAESSDFTGGEAEIVPMDSLAVAEAADTLHTDSVAGQPPVAAPVEEKEETTAPPVYRADATGYKIDGTQTTYTIKEGETLTKVALRFYGSKAYWPYIVKHNPDKIKNPDNVPYGTTIKIPKLVEK